MFMPIRGLQIIIYRQAERKIKMRLLFTIILVAFAIGFGMVMGIMLIEPDDYDDNDDMF